MWEMIAALMISAAPPLAPPDHSLLPQAPYVSCRDGYIAPSLDLCPPPSKTYTPNDDPKPIGGGGPGGLLGLGIGGIL